MKISDRRRIYTGTACINPSPPAVAHFATTRLPAYDCPEGYPAPQVKIENPVENPNPKENVGLRK